MDAPLAPARDVALVGTESAGKSSLVAALTGSTSRAENLAGSTLSVERTAAGTRTFVDTPGLLLQGDSATTRTTLTLLAEDAPFDVLVVVRATDLDAELRGVLPLVAGRRGAVVVTHWDHVGDSGTARSALAAVEDELGVEVVTVDARARGDAVTGRIGSALGRPGTFPSGPLRARVGWRIEPRPTPLEHRRLGPPLGLAVLLTPAVGAVSAALAFAGLVDPHVTEVTERLAVRAAAWPHPLAAVVAGEYGLLTMGPLLVVWAAPTVIVLALLLGLLKASGLLDRATTAVHPLVRPFGLTGHDLVRVVAGHGCNVPAVTATRSCSACSRDATIGAIAFGAACSYQLGAALAVLTAARRLGLVVPYVGALLVGALLHARALSPRRQRRPGGPLDLHRLRGRTFLTAPRWVDVRREAAATLRHATGTALPVFLLVSVGASLLAATGVLDLAGRATCPLMAALRLPAEVALPVVLAAVRKDGALLLGEPSTLAALDGAQLLAALLLAGALLPCLVTTLTIARERGARSAGRLVARQAIGAVLLAGAVAWLGVLA
jgi:ferrous iron transport protein B